HFRLALSAARLRRRPPLARGDGGVPSTQRRPAAAARSKAWRGNARPGQAAQDGGGESVRGFRERGPRSGLSGKAEGGDFKRHFTAAKGRMTPPRRAPHLWAYAGVGVVDHKDLLAEAGRGNGRWDGGQLKVVQDAGNHRLLGDGRNDA